MADRLRAVHSDERGNELLEDWVLWMQAQGMAERTYAERPQMVTRAARHATVEAHGLTSRQIMTYLSRAKIGQSTRANYHVALTAWFAWLIDNGHRDDNPMDGIPKPKVPRRRPRPMETAHLKKVLSSRMHRRTRTMILLAAYQGLRVSEIAKVRGEDVDLVGGRIYVVGKGGVDEWLPLHQLIADEAASYPRRGWWFPTHVGNRSGSGHILGRSVSTIVSNAVHRAGVIGSAHPARHWYGTTLANKGANLRTVQELLRHKNLATTAIYVAVGEDQRAEAIGRLPDIDGP